MKLYTDQQHDFDRLREAFRQHRRVLFVAPTGYGKTVLACTIARGAAERGTKTVFLVHRQELIDQTVRSFGACGIHCGVISPGWTPRQSSIQVASVFTLARRRGHEFDFVVVDECHHAAAGSWQHIAEKFPDASYLGLTATPIRLDGAGLGNSFDTMVQALTMRELIDMGRLAKYEYWAPETVDLSGLRCRGNDYNRDALDAAMRDRRITGNVIQHYKRICDGAPFIAFCVSVAHAQRVAEDFRAAGYPVEPLDGNMDRTERRRIVKSLGRQIVGITSCDLISEGFDVPAVVCAILLRKTESLGLYMQQTGRALRVAPGKSKAVILDCVGNVLRHGMPDMPREWTLTYGCVTKREASESGVDIRRCEQCYAVHEYAAMCPYCGYIYPPKIREVETRDGELKQLTQEEMIELEALAKRSGKLGDFHKVAKAKGMKSGWAWGAWRRNMQSNSLKHAKIGG